MSFPRLGLLLTFSVVLFLAGCQNQEEIRHYQVPRAEATKNKAPSRMLAAMVPHDAQVWFFKMLGPASAVGEHKAEFEGFIRSIKFSPEAVTPLTWTVPEGWREEAKEAGPSKVTGLQRYATFQLGPKERPLEMTVLPLPRVGEAGDVLANVNRWRGQLGLSPLTQAELPQVVQEVKVGDDTATLVDLGAGRADNALQEKARASNSAEDKLPLTYKKPDSWKQTPAGEFAVAAFEVTAKGGTAKITVSQLGGQGGGLVANINRWRRQLNLSEVGEQALRKDLREIEVDGSKAVSVDLLGPEEGGKRKEIVGVILERGNATWFFKMTGPAALVAGEKPNFEAFVRSVRFDRPKR